MPLNLARWHPQRAFFYRNRASRWKKMSVRTQISDRRRLQSGKAQNGPGEAA
jgi:hypothetical protein